MNLGVLNKDPKEKHSHPAKICDSAGALVPTLRRILKYTPALVMGLLVVAWVATIFGRLKLEVSRKSDRLFPATCGVAIEFGSVECFGRNALFQTGLGLDWTWNEPPLMKLNTGHLSTYKLYGRQLRYDAGLTVPIPLLVTALLPLALGPFISFRFRLWHYLAYTALVALELAYYLRWQE